MIPRIRALLLCAGLLPALPAQNVLLEVEGQSASDWTGHSLAGGADFDADGFDDLVVGAPRANTSALFDNGLVRVISGRTGLPLFELDGDAATDRFGFSVAIGGDIDGDGVPELIVGAPLAAGGAAQVFSGTTGTLLATFSGSGTSDEFGSAVVGRLDWDHDGVDDIAVGAPLGDGGAYVTPGYVKVYSGADFSLLYTLSGVFDNGEYGYALAAGDVDGDGYGDLVVGSPRGGATQEGMVHVHDAGGLIWSWTGDHTNDFFGCSVGTVKSNADPYADVLVGAYQDPTGAGVAGSVRLFNGKNGNIRHTWYGSAIFDYFGRSLANVGDLDGDGLSEFAVGATENHVNSTGGRVNVYSAGSPFLELFEIRDDSAQDFGYAVARAGDLNADGTRDIAVGARDPGLGLAGLARVYSSGCPGFANYCTAGTSASGCQALITASGTPSASAPAGFELTASGAEGSVFGIFFFGDNGRQANSWGNGTSFQCVVPPVKRGGLILGGGTNGACDGSFVQDLNAHWCPTCEKPNHNFGAGAVVQAQLWYRDPNSTSNQTTSLSDAAEFVLCPR